MSGSRAKTGFTIIELLIVILVLAILAAIIFVAYSGVQAKARDSVRISGIVTIQRALMAYKAQNGSYPLSTSSQSGAWDASSDTSNGHVFLQNLKASNLISTIPLDPVNVSYDSMNNTGIHYNYYTYTDMSYLASIGCATNRGNMIVLLATKTESQSPWPTSPGFSCTGRNFNNEGSWVWGDYDN